MAAVNEKESLAAEMDKKDDEVLPTVNPATEKAQAAASASKIHPAVYVASWISLSSAVILYNKWLLSTKDFHFPIILTTWHLVFATLMTQMLARFTHVLDSRKKVPMTGKVYVRAIVPIGIFFSLSLICGNVAYLHLSVSFIQMLKATTPVAVLLISWAMGLAPASFKTLGNVSLIVLGVVIASYVEIKFVLIGVIFQLAGLTFEATRLVMVQKLLSSAEFKMDPLVSLYYFAPACAVMNGVIALVLEVPKIKMTDISNVGYGHLLANAMVAFMLNVSVVFLIGKTSSLAMTLCGVLKDILLVAASMVLFGDPVTLLQAFGYSIALAGLVYYRIGGEKLREYAAAGQKAWADYGILHPGARRAIIIAAIVITLLTLAGGVHSTGYSTEYTKYAQAKVNAYLGATGQR